MREVQLVKVNEALNVGKEEILAKVTNCRQLFEFLCSPQKPRGRGHFSLFCRTKILHKGEDFTINRPNEGFVNLSVLREKIELVLKRICIDLKSVQYLLQLSTFSTFRAEIEILRL